MNPAPERPPLVILAHPDGSPDWQAVNERTRAVVLWILEDAGEGITGVELCRRAGLHGIHPAVVHYARRALHAAGHLRCRRGRGRGLPIFWRLAPPVGRGFIADPTRGGTPPTVRDTMTGGQQENYHAR